MGFLKKLKKINETTEEPSPILNPLSEALTKTNDSTKSFAIYGIVEADKDNKLEISVLLNFLRDLIDMKGDIPLKNDAIDLISSKILEKGDSALSYLKEIKHKSTTFKVIINKLIYNIESSKELDEFKKIFEKLD